MCYHHYLGKIKPHRATLLNAMECYFSRFLLNQQALPARRQGGIANLTPLCSPLPSDSEFKGLSELWWRLNFLDNWNVTPFRISKVVDWDSITFIPLHDKHQTLCLCQNRNRSCTNSSYLLHYIVQGICTISLRRISEERIPLSENPSRVYLDIRTVDRPSNVAPAAPMPRA